MEELGRWVHQERQVSTCQRIPLQYDHPAEGGRILSAALVPYRYWGTVGREVEPKHLLSQIQTLPFRSDEGRGTGWAGGTW